MESSPDILTLLGEALQSSSWVSAVILGLFLVLSLLDKAFKWNLPIIGNLGSFVVNLANMFKTKPPAPAPGEKTGVEAVVKVENEK
jgi:hypothetical protein